MNNNFEMEILGRYLPKMLEPKDVEIILRNIITVNGFTSVKETGQIMSKIKLCEEASLIDMKIVNVLIKKILN
jgi:uncharacterized protein YqeY